ncbi:hypothetical protein [Butyrivibrio sp. AC2005]|uniref:hypothetical protein n=1 Tax=Butyrivibrio sp. AC2005 TaxID=1280672 RepID=UPI000406BC27|nr:hypothetical protein [Butyrivibrio sp. AC2005]
MNKFFEKLKDDTEFRSELRDYLAGKTDEMNEIINEYNHSRDKLVIGAINDFAKEHGIEISDSEESRKKCREICDSVHKSQVGEYESALKMLFS